MIEYVFRHSRRVSGKRILSRFFSGRYSLRRGERLVTVALDTTDERVARKRLRDLVAAKQREAEGIVAPAAVRSAAGLPLVELIADYRLDLAGRGLEPGHVRDTVGRITRMVRDAGWVFLQDVRPESFMKWRASASWSAKTKKEYQTSINAFLNWLVRVDRLLVNPLVKVDRVDVRGKAVRKSRAFTREEIAALYRVAPKARGIVYLFLVYTGTRKNEAQSLLWSDLHLGPRPFVLIRAENTKDRDKRAVPLKPQLADILSAELDELKAMSSERGHVFTPFPSDDALHADLKRAGIERKDAAGRVVHFHAFRKTFQTWGAASGVGQRAAQELLGHSDPSLTANVYTDVAGLALHDEVAKLPWVDDTQPDTHERVCPGVYGRFRGMLSDLVALAQKAASEAEAGISAPPSLAARHGFEPSSEEWQDIDSQLATWLAAKGYTQLDTHARAAVSAICVLARLSSGEESAPESGAKKDDESGPGHEPKPDQPHRSGLGDPA